MSVAHALDLLAQYGEGSSVGRRVNAYQHLIALTTGLSMSLSCRTSGEPYLSWTIAFIMSS